MNASNLYEMFPRLHPPLHHPTPTSPADPLPTHPPQVLGLQESKGRLDPQNWRGLTLTSQIEKYWGTRPRRLRLLPGELLILGSLSRRLDITYKPVQTYIGNDTRHFVFY